MSGDDRILVFARAPLRSGEFDPKVGRQMLWLTAALLAFAVSCLAIFIGTRGGEFRAGSETPPPAALLRPSDEVRGMASPIPPEWQAARDFMLLTFSDGLERKYRTFNVRPEQVCRVIAEALGADPAPWAASELSGLGTECVYGPIFYPLGAQPDGSSSSIFVILRGTADEVTQLNVKVNVLSADDLATISQAADRLQSALSGVGSVTLPRTAWAAVKAGNKESYRTRDLQFTVRPEVSDPRRVLLTATFGERAKPALATNPQALRCQSSKAPRMATCSSQTDQ